VLRQDPDAIMVGEIRDAQTAALALRAALTGHLVLSSLHTADAAGAVERLRDLGMPPYLCAATVRGVLAQRLVRRRCPACGAGAALPGCPTCGGSGFSGRVAFFEFLDCGSCADLVGAGAGAAALREWMASRGLPASGERRNGP
jgi:type II secretory ATPase GspE/PulE/Tfp pilus assembly ATPase PilB-like protein